MKEKCINNHNKNNNIYLYINTYIIQKVKNKWNIIIIYTRCDKNRRLKRNK